MIIMLLVGILLIINLFLFLFFVYFNDPIPLSTHHYEQLYRKVKHTLFMRKVNGWVVDDIQQVSSEIIEEVGYLSDTKQIYDISELTFMLVVYTLSNSYLRKATLKENLAVLKIKHLRVYVFICLRNIHERNLFRMFS